MAALFRRITDAGQRRVIGARAVAWPGQSDPALIPDGIANPAFWAAEARSALTTRDLSLAAATVAWRARCRPLFDRWSLVAGAEHRQALRILVEEGLPSPLTGRPGAIVTTAAAIVACPSGIPAEVLERAADERLGPAELADLAMVAALADWAVRSGTAPGAV